MGPLRQRSDTCYDFFDDGKGQEFVEMQNWIKWEIGADLKSSNPYWRIIPQLVSG